MTGSNAMMKKKTQSKQLALSIQNITKEYNLRHQKPTLMGSVFGLEKREKFLALNNVSLNIFKGEKVGIIGRNGSGKTTILKIISGITTPTHGSVSVYGKVVSLIELEAGFHPELSGMENIFLNGLLIGMTLSEIRDNYQSIVQFSGIGRFIDAPLHTYSSGMSLRLGFSVAVHSNPDILVLDEGIAVGDQAFRKKSLAKINEFFRKGKTIIIVSHWLEYLKENCNRIVWLEGGKVKMDGKPNIVDAYST